VIVEEKRNIIIKTIKIVDMKTLEEVLENNVQYILSRNDIIRLATYVPYDKLHLLGIKLKPDVSIKEFEEKWNKKVKPFTRENIIKELKYSVAYGFEVALEPKEILEYIKKLNVEMALHAVMLWNWILEEGLENWPGSNCTYHGLPLFKATALKYNFDNPIGDDSGKEEKYNS